MKNILKVITLVMLLGTLIGSVPLAAMAKNDKEKNGNDSSITSSTSVEVKENKGNWWRVWELFTFGNKNGKIPPGLLHAPGIQKKIGHLGTTTVGFAPVISGISVSNVSTTSVKINWQTNKPTTNNFYFATSSPVGTSTSAAVTSTQQSMKHTVTLTGLGASTTYFYRIVARDLVGRTSSTTNLSFMTASVTVVDVTAPVISHVMATTSVVTTTTGTTTGPVHVTWTTNEPASSKVWFGTSTPVISGTSTQIINLPAFVTSHDVTLPTLTASTTYYMMVGSTDASGNTSSSDELNFTVEQ